MLELNQFRHSAFCLKVRMVLEAKGLKYRVIEITPGVGQFEIFKLSGQRKVPVLVDKGQVIADSSAIVRYLDHTYPEPQLLPNDPKEAAQVHLIEDWADTTFAQSARKTLLKAAAMDPELRIALLPEEIPETIRKFVKGFSLEVISDVAQLVNQGEEEVLLESLKKLSNLVEANKWLIGQKMSIADIAVASQLSLLRFPASSGIPLVGKGYAGFSDHPDLENLFSWRDDLEMSLMQSNPSSI